MSVQNQSSIHRYVGDGNTKNFIYNFYLEDPDNLRVFINNVDQSTGLGFSIIINDGNEGGTVVLRTTPKVNDAIVIYRDLPIIRDTDYAEGAGILSSTLDHDQDYQTRILQDIKSRSLTINGNNEIDVGGARIVNVQNPSGASDAVNKQYVDAAISGIDIPNVVVPPTTPDTSSGMSAPVYQNFTASAGQKLFETTIIVQPRTTNTIYTQVMVNGVYQTEGPSRSYTISDSNIVLFNTALLVGDEVQVLSWAEQDNETGPVDVIDPPGSEGPSLGPVNDANGVIWTIEDGSLLKDEVDTSEDGEELFLLNGFMFFLDGSQYKWYDAENDEYDNVEDPRPDGENLGISAGKLTVDGVVVAETNNVVAIIVADGFTFAHENADGEYWGKNALGVWTQISAASVYKNGKPIPDAPDAPDLTHKQFYETATPTKPTTYVNAVPPLSAGTIKQTLFENTTNPRYWRKDALGMHDSPKGIEYPPPFGYGCSRSHDREARVLTDWDSPVDTNAATQLARIVRKDDEDEIYYNWEPMKEWIDDNRGRTLIFNLFTLPEFWQDRPGTPWAYGYITGGASPASVAGLAGIKKFVQDFYAWQIEEYGQYMVQVMEVWNEPENDYSPENGGFIDYRLPIPPTRKFWNGSWIDLAKIAKAIKDGLPSGILLAAAAFEDANAVDWTGSGIVKFKQALTYIGAGEIIDIFTFHRYLYGGMTDWYANLQTQLIGFSALWKTYFPNARAIDTECGCESPYKLSDYSSSDAASFIRKQVASGVSYGLDIVCLYNYRDDGGVRNIDPDDAAHVAALNDVHGYAGSWIYKSYIMSDDSIWMSVINPDGTQEAIHWA